MGFSEKIMTVRSADGLRLTCRHRIARRVLQLMPGVLLVQHD